MESIQTKELDQAAPETEGITIPWARFYDPVVGLLSLLTGGRERPEQATLELVKLEPGEKVLDVGCGTGTLALAPGARSARRERCMALTLGRR